PPLPFSTALMTKGMGTGQRRARTLAVALARVGYAAEGTVYLAVGAIAGIAAVRTGSSPQGPDSALATVAHLFGSELLLGIGLGLAALALWQLLTGLLDLEGRGRGGIALLQRAAA